MADQPLDLRAECGNQHRITLVLHTRLLLTEATKGCTIACTIQHACALRIRISDNRAQLQRIQAAPCDARSILDFEFEKRKPFDDRNPARKKEFQDLTKYLDGTIENLYTFLDAYVVLHRNMVKPSERTRIMLKSLEEGLVKEYAS